MKSSIKDDAWVFVLVQNPGKNEDFVGLHDSEADLTFLPVFTSKEDALTCSLNIPADIGKKREVHAILYEVLVKEASNNGFWLYITDSEGGIKDRIAP